MFSVPIRLPSLANQRLPWRRMAALKRDQRRATRLCMLTAGTAPDPPWTVTITRVGPRVLDDDNLASACKYVRDEVAAVLGVDDGSTLYTWKYAQRRGPYGVDVEVTT